MKAYKKHIKYSKINIYMLMLAIYPVLNLYYFANTAIYLPQVITLLLAVYSLYKKKRIIKGIPLAYILCWAYVAFHDIFFVAPFKLTKLLPGGVNFFMFSIGWAMYANNFNIQKLRKYVNIVFGFAAILFIYQNIAYYIFGQETSVILPLSNHMNYGEFTFKELQLHQKYHFNGRFASIFAEPSYWAQYCLVVLALELFCKENLNKIYTKKAAIISLVLLLIKSGVGVLGLGLIAIIKLWHIVFKTKNIKKIGYLILAAPFAILAVYLYASSDIGQGLIARGNEISSIQGEGARSAFLRLFYGWNYLAEISPVQLMFGADELVGMSIDENSFFNGMTYFILLHGIVGFSFLCIFYYGCARKSVLSGAFAIILLALSMMEAIYLNPIMLMCTVLIVASRMNNIKVSV